VLSTPCSRGGSGVFKRKENKMPIDYKQYPANWKTEIRPAILKRAENCCEMCNIQNGITILRGKYNGIDVYQEPDYGKIFRADNSEYYASDYVGEVCQSEKDKFITIVLTIAHLDHDINNNDYLNLKALCQKCHLNYDKEHHSKNSRATRNFKKGLQELF